MQTQLFFGVLGGTGGLTSRLNARPGDRVPVALDQTEALPTGIAVPETPSAIAPFGRVALEAGSQGCNEVNAAGIKDVALALVHKVCEPSHREAEPFARAVATAVRQRHWQVGNMPSPRACHVTMWP